MKKPITYSTAKVAEIAGVTLRQLQWWDEQGITPLPKDGKKHFRSWSKDDLLRVRLIASMRNKGISLQRIRGVMEIATGMQRGYFVVVTKDGARIVGREDLLGYIVGVPGPSWVIQI